MDERHEGVVRMDAQMWALVAEMEALKSVRAAMEAENSKRALNGHALAYDGADFMENAKEIAKIAERLRKEI